MTMAAVIASTIKAEAREGNLTMSAVRSAADNSPVSVTLTNEHGVAATFSVDPMELMLLPTLTNRVLTDLQEARVKLVSIGAVA